MAWRAPRSALLSGGRPRDDWRRVEGGAAGQRGGASRGCRFDRQVRRGPAPVGSAARSHPRAAGDAAPARPVGPTVVQGRRVHGARAARLVERRDAARRCASGRRYIERKTRRGAARRLRRAPRARGAHRQASTPRGFSSPAPASRPAPSSPRSTTGPACSARPSRSCRAGGSRSPSAHAPTGRPCGACVSWWWARPVLRPLPPCRPLPPPNSRALRPPT